MRPSLLDVLRCPRCTDGAAPLTPSSELVEERLGEAREVREGELACARCAARFPIREGILDLLPDPPPEILAEIEGTEAATRARLADPAAAREVLQQPYVEDPAHPAHWLSVQGNLEQLVGWAREARPGLGEEPLLIDLGCGTCYTTAALAREGYRAVGLDISINRLAGMGAADDRMRAGAPLFDRLRADMARLPFGDGVAAAVTTLASLHHALDLESTLAEAARVLRPGGLLLVVGEPVAGILKNREHGHHEIEHLEWNEHSYSRGEYLAAMEQAGFRVTVEFPVFIEQRLARRRFGDGRLNQLLGRTAGLAWALPPLRALLRGPLFPLLQALFGIQLLARGRKAVAKQLPLRRSRPLEEDLPVEEEMREERP